ncbi:MAG: hypothetical protein ABI667_01150 [Sphingomicrobium sp.]
MIHFLPDLETTTALPSPFQARVSGLAHAFSVVERLGGKSDGDVHSLPAVKGEVNRLAEDLSERLAAASAAGLEAIAAIRELGLEANPAAAQMLADMIRNGLDELGAVTSL